MRTGTSFLLTAISLTALSLPAKAASPSDSDLEREYVQVRKIALKDARVQEAFAKANERLEDKILQIDPALKPIVDREKSAPAPIQTRPMATEHQVAAAPAAPGREHIVLKGETLDSIAIHYKVKVAALERINHITDARKLRIGQKLVIPGGESADPQPLSQRVAQPAPQPSAPPAAQPSAPPAAASQPPAQPKESESLWDRVKNTLSGNSD